MTPTPHDITSAETVVAEWREVAHRLQDGMLRHAKFFSADNVSGLLALIESQRATIERVEREREAVYAAMGNSVRFMDPPDGGDPTQAEMVANMRRQLEAAEARVTALEAEKGGFRWFDIESAPKSGVSILVCGCSYGPAVRIAHWGNGRFLGRKKGYEQGWSHVPGHTCDPKFWAPIPMALSRSSTEAKNDEC